MVLLSFIIRTFFMCFVIFLEHSTWTQERGKRTYRSRIRSATSAATTNWFTIARPPTSSYYQTTSCTLYRATRCPAVFSVPASSCSCFISTANYRQSESSCNQADTNGLTPLRVNGEKAAA
jgi:hypothetical protein